MEIYTKLITKEDSSGLHKVLGFACLVSFLMRLSLVGKSDMGFDGSWSTPATLGLHLSLSLSSFAFKIPSKRITTGYRIWPEARLHALVFACRSFACIMYTWWWKRRQAKEDAEDKDGASDLFFCMGNTFIVLLSCAAADLASYSVGPLYRSHTIRDLKAPSAAKYFFSVMQFHATAACLLGSRRYTTQFLFVLVIQVNAFLMTLQRRNIASHSVLLVIYGLMLAIGFTLKSLEDLSQGIFWLVHTMANFAVLLRIGLRVNKYLLWTGMGWVVHVVLRLENYRGFASDDILWQACVASYAAIVGLGFLKLGGEPRKND